LELRPATRIFSTLISAIGMVLFAAGVADWHTTNAVQFTCYLILTILASVLKVGWQGPESRVSFNFLFVLIGMLQFSASEVLLLAGAAGAGTEWVRADKARRYQRCLFGAASMVLAVVLSDSALRVDFVADAWLDRCIQLFVLSSIFFVCHTFPAATVEGLESGRGILQHARDGYLWAFPHYLATSVSAALFTAASSALGWRLTVVTIPVVYLLFRSYRQYLGRMEEERAHHRELADLHMRTIGALALAIDAKDHTTHEHVQRVRIYSMEMGRQFALGEDELEALRAASVLHDIGKLAVPEHIISKPGKLTPEEFAKMKIHPVVGAEILERVRFPYPVVPIVRSHHEKWDGSGYPDGLRGEAIPIGARILAAVDCLDALASDRQYRKALPLDEAMQIVRRDAGKAFDPKVVELLNARYVEMEEKARAEAGEPFRLSTDIVVERGAGPAAGYAESNPVLLPRQDAAAPAASFNEKIALAHQEAHSLYALAESLGSSLSLDETFSMLAQRLRKLVPHDAIAVYLRRAEKLLPEFVSGENFRLFASLEIPVGQGLSGWVAETGKPIINGNPSVEPGYLNDAGRFSTLRSALAAPLEGANGIVGVLTLYQAERDAFSREHLRIVQVVASKLALVVENSLRYLRAESKATQDALTGLANTRALFARMDEELARARRQNTPVGVLVADFEQFPDYREAAGDEAADRVLRTVAEALRRSSREYDVVARLGAAEFVVLVPGMREEDLAPRAQRLRDQCREADGGLAGLQNLNLAVGWAHFPTSGADAEELLAEADRQVHRSRAKARKPAAATAR
jgi:diguanylate cyclase (GGDEF)-like protein/putative nucleotidyltransferase with HDIG domain